jgi:hypothetical protein
VKKESPLRRFWQFLKIDAWLPWMNVSSGQEQEEPEVVEVLHVDLLKSMVRGIANTQEEELTCDECFEEVDTFAEMVLAGKNAAEAMPLVEHHLQMCQSCRSEFEALLDALRALQTDDETP